MIVLFTVLLWMRRMRLLGLVWLGLAASLAGCAGAGLDYNDPAVRIERVDQRIQGVWRLVSYVPDSPLSPAMLIAMQNDKIVVRFDMGRVTSATTALTFDRAYRITEVEGESFKLTLVDPDGIAYESIARFEPSGEIAFRTITAPWVGQGVLAREGAAVGVQPAYPY
jgi:hypothetical protein